MDQMGEREMVERELSEPVTAERSPREGHRQLDESEIRRRRGFHSRGQEAVVLLLSAADSVQGFFTEVLEPHGVTLQQYNVLRILRGGGSTGLATLQVAERMMQKTPGITRLLDRLERRGWVHRERCLQDRRRVLVHLTQPGRQLLADLDEVVDRADDEALVALSPLELDELIAILGKVSPPRASE